MSLETEVASLTTATTSLLAAVNVSKATLDQKVADAGTQAAAASTSAGTAHTKAGEAATSATAASTSANTAATAVVTQLNSIKTQTEAIRDQAMAGLGATDNSQAMAVLAGGIKYALDLAGVAAKAVGGGAVELQAGTAAIPSMTSATDVRTGVFFPAIGTMAVSVAGVERLRVSPEGRFGFGTTTPTGVLDVVDNKLRVRTPQTPANATAAGNEGEIAWDANFVYVCTATNAWRRAALATW